MSMREFLNFEKFDLSHQVALVGEYNFIYKSLISFARTISLNLDIIYIVLITHAWS